MEAELWLIILGGGLLSVAIRLAPEAWLRGRAPPQAISRVLPWLPVAVAGALAAVLHLDQPADLRWQYIAAAIPATLTLLWKRTFYLPLLVGAATLALIRWLL